MLTKNFELFTIIKVATMATSRFPSGLIIMLISRWSHWTGFTHRVDTDIYQGGSLDGQATQENESDGNDVDDKEKADGENVKDPEPEQDEKANGEILNYSIYI